MKFQFTKTVDFSGRLNAGFRKLAIKSIIESDRRGSLGNTLSKIGMSNYE